MLRSVATERERTRCRERLERLGGSSQDCGSIQREAISDLQRVLGFDRWCWPFADPDTLVPLSGVAEHDYGPRLRRALELEFSGRDFAAKDVLARRVNSVGSLSAETGGDLARSPRWDEVMRPVGIGDLAAVACRDALGCWGWIEVYRDSGDRRFEADDLGLLASAGASLGPALRRAFIGAAGTQPVEPGPPGVVVLDSDLGLVAWTASARAWIDALPAARMFAAWGMLPALVYPVATLARSPATRVGAHALERAVDGRWVMIEAAPLEEDDEGRTAVTIRGALPRDIFDVLCRAYALTPRERSVVAAVLAGLDTRALTERLFISRHTVQDHLKSVFAKVGVHSRRELRTAFDAAGVEAP
jgi:DNA-binding CsgD family transcriptional regulator